MAGGVQERGIATRTAVLDAAFALFGDRGYDATSLEAILERAGVKRGALYHHFASKQAVFDAVLERILAEVAAQLDADYDPDGDPVDCLRAGCHAWLDGAVNPAVQRIVLLDAPVVVGWQRWRALDEQYFEQSMTHDLGRAGSPGGGRAVDLSLLAGVLIAGINEIALRAASAPEADRATLLAAGHVAVDLLVDRLIVGP